MSTTFCPTCGATIDAQSKFCPMCGQRVSELQDEVRELPINDVAESPINEESTFEYSSTLEPIEQVNLADDDSKKTIKHHLLSKTGLLLAASWVLVVIISILFEGVVPVVGVLAFIATPVLFLIFIVRAIKKKAKKTWALATGFSLLIFLTVLVIDTSICRHDWVPATCQAPQTCALCDKTEGTPLTHIWEEATCAAPETCRTCKETRGSALEHSPGNWKTSSTNTVAATVTSKKYCSVCNEVVDRQTVSLKQLHDGVHFLTTPKEFTERLGNKLDEIQGCYLTTRAGEVNGNFVLGVLLNGKKVAAFMFTPSGGDELIPVSDANTACSSKVIGTVDTEYIAEVILALIETCDPTLSFSEVKAAGTDLVENGVMTKNGLTYIFSLQSDGALLGATIS